MLRLRLTTFLVVGIGLLSGSAMLAQGQERPDLSDRIERAIMRGDADALEKLFGRRVELSLLGSRKSYSRAQAKFVLEDLFSNWNPVQYRILSESRNRQSWFLESQIDMRRRSVKYRVFCRMRRVEGRWVIKELWFTEKR